MKKRMIDPEMFSDDRLANCGSFGLLLYMGLLCSCDVEGRLEDRPNKIKAKIFPYFDVNVDEVLFLLSKQDLIKRYKSGEHFVIQIVGFSNKGLSYNNEKSYGLPAYVESKDEVIEAVDQLVPNCLEAGSQLNINNNIIYNNKIISNKDSITKERSKTTVEQEAEDYILDEKTNRKKKTSVLVLPERLPENLEQVRPQLLLWLQWKQERRQGYQKLGLEALLKRLANCSPRAIMDAIEQSMSNGWTGLFPEKLDKPSGGLFNSAMQTQNMIDKVIQEEEAKYHG